MQNKMLINALKSGLVILIVMGCSDKPSSGNMDYPNPSSNAESKLMLAGDWVPEDTHQINFDSLPKVPSEHAVVSDVHASNGVNQHNYLIFHDGKYWAMWSDGPGREDRVGQRVKFATSMDGLQWSEPEYLTPEPPGSAKDSEFYGQRTDKGYRWISGDFGNVTGSY